MKIFVLFCFVFLFFLLYLFFCYFQVALVVFLSHIGSFVPADAATVGLTDRFDLYMPTLSFFYVFKPAT